MLLALDTATSASTVALHDGRSVLASKRVTDSSQHAELLTLLIRDVLAEAGVVRSDLTHVICGVGPGPFTGLRVGLMTARTMAYALQIPLIGICTLDAIAHERLQLDATPITVVTTARRHEYYWATYDAEGRRLAGPEVSRAEGIPTTQSQVGTIDESAIPDACWIAQLAVDALARGEAPSSFGASHTELPVTSQGTATADFLRGHTLLAAEALYLRRPDAVPPPSVSQTVAPLAGLRPMRWWDIDAVASIDSKVFAATAWSEGTFWSELAGVPDTRFYIVAEEHGRVVGYAGITVFPPEAEVQTIAVDSSMQGRGLGRLLLDALLSAAAERGCTRILLEVRADNTAAIRLYESRGFVSNGRRRDYYGAGQDAVLMRRDAP